MMPTEADSRTVPSRRRLVAVLLALPVALGLVLRLALVVGWHSEALTGWTLPAMLIGTVLDAATALLMTLPLLLIALSSRGALLDGRWLRRAVVVAWVFICGFQAAAEWCFWSEFTARLNHIALDYLIYPHEVFVNIWESYNVPVVVGALLAVAVAIGWPLTAWTLRPAPLPRRVPALGLLVAATAVALGTVWALPEHIFGNRIIDGVAQNGMVQLGRAFSTAHLDYDHFYRAPAAAEAEARALADFGLTVPSPDAPPRKHVGPATTAEHPLDLLVVLEESLGAEFSGGIGGTNPCTPELDRWSKDGWVFENLIATGNRTVRGIEGILCSLLPVPPDSVVKREHSVGMASLAQVMKRAGYRCEWFYGGVGSFDHMAPFALDCGWDAFNDDPIVGASPYPPSAFRTAWGVADGPVFDQLLKRQIEAQQHGERLFSTVLTVSNHKPFLVPGAAGNGTTVRTRVMLGLLLLGLLVATWWSLSRWRERIGLLPLVATLVLGWCGYGVYAFIATGGKESRETAVRYADSSVTTYLDQAKAAGILDHTVVLVVGDHGARVYGKQTMPLDSYRIFGLLLAPGRAPQRTTRLCSQLDLAPTLLSLAGIAADGPFCGEDLTAPGAADRPGRAYMQHNRDIGLLTDDALVVLGLPRTITCYRRPDPTAMRFTAVPAAEAERDPRLADLMRRIEADFAFAYHVYQAERWRLPDTDAAP